MKKNIQAITFYFYPVTGGLETHVLEVFSRLAKKGYSVTVHASANTFTGVNVLPANDVLNSMRVKRYSSHFFGFWPKIDWAVANVIVLENYNIFPHGMLLAIKGWHNVFRKNKIKIFISPHLGLMPEWPSFGRIGRVIKKYYNKLLGVPLINLFADGVHAVSEYEKEIIMRTGVVPNLITVINNGLEDSAFDATDYNVDKAIVEQVKNFKPYVIQPARIYPVKNQMLAIEALEFMNKDLSLVFIGQLQDNSYYESLSHKIKSLGMEKRVHFLGVITGSDKYYLMRNAVAGAHVSFKEAYCIVALELMSQKTVSVFSDHKSFLEITNKGERDFVSDPYDSKKLAETLNYIYDNSQTGALNEMKSKGYEYVKLKTWGNITQQLENYFFQKNDN